MKSVVFMEVLENSNNLLLLRSQSLFPEQISAGNVFSLIMHDDAEFFVL